jgi:hypothetical protein
MVDVWMIVKNMSFNWQDIVEEAKIQYSENWSDIVRITEEASSRECMAQAFARGKIVGGS